MSGSLVDFRLAAVFLGGAGVQQHPCIPCSWRECVTLFTEELPWLAGEDLEKVMGRALYRWIGWELPGL